MITKKGLIPPLWEKGQTHTAFPPFTKFYHLTFALFSFHIKTSLPLPLPFSHLVTQLFPLFYAKSSRKLLSLGLSVELA